MDGPRPDASADDPGDERSPGRSAEGGVPERVRDVLIELARTLQRYTLYPSGHPALEGGADEVAGELAELQQQLGALELGVAPDRLVVLGEPTDPGQEQLASLGRRLHEHGLSSLTLRPGLEPGELSDLLDALSRPPDREPLIEPGGEPPAWEHVTLEARDYGALALSPEEQEGGRDGEEGGSRAERLWEGLARAALAGIGGGSDVASVEDRERPPPGTDPHPARSGPGSPDGKTAPGEAGRGEEAADGPAEDAAGEDAADARPEGDARRDARPAEDGAEEGAPGASPGRIATAVESFSDDATYVRTVRRRMMEIAAELADRPAGEEAAADEVRERLGELLEELDDESFRELLRAGEDPDASRRDLLVRTSAALPVGAVVDLVERAAEAGEVDASSWMLELLRKLASHAGLDVGDAPEEAGAALRDQVRMLAEAEGPAGDGADGHGRLVDRSAGAAAAPVAGDDDRQLEPGRVLQTCLEASRLGPPGERALDELLAAGEIPGLIDLLDAVPGDREAAGRVWDRIEDVGSVERVLERDPPDFDALERLVDRLGLRAVDPLIGRLAESESRKERRRLFGLLADLGPPLVEHLAAWLEDDRWFVQRNMLALMVEVGAVPADFDEDRWLGHDHPAVRREAYRLLLDDPDRRSRVVRRALAEEDARLVSLGLSAVGQDPDPGLVAPVADHFRADELPPDTAVLAVRVLERVGTDRALEVLADLCLRRRLWPFWKRTLVAKSPPVLAALEAMARSWPNHPGAGRALAEARASEDPEVRDAVERPGPAGEPGERAGEPGSEPETAAAGAGGDP